MSLELFKLTIDRQGAQDDHIDLGNLPKEDPIIVCAESAEEAVEIIQSEYQVNDEISVPGATPSQNFRCYVQKGRYLGNDYQCDCRRIVYPPEKKDE